MQSSIKNTNDKETFFFTITQKTEFNYCYSTFLPVIDSETFINEIENKVFFHDKKISR
jgi:hypothetical protein